MKRFIYTVLFIVIFSFGVAMRAPEVIAHNYLFGFDQGRDYLAAYSIAELHKMTLIGAEVGAGSAGLQYLFHGPGYFYLLALMYRLFQSDPYGGLLLMFAFGVGTLLVVFVTTRKIFGEPTALVSLFLVGAAPLIAPQSRFVWNHHPSSIFIALYLYAMYRIFDKPRIFAPMSILIAGLIYHFELAIAVPLVIAGLISQLTIYRIRTIRTYVFDAIALVAAFSPMALFESRHGFQATKSLITYLLHPSNSGKETASQLLSQHINGFIANLRDSFVFDYGRIQSQHYLLVLTIAAIIATWYVWHERNKSLRLFFLFLGLLIVTSFVVFWFLHNSVWNYYLIHLHFVYIYFFAYTFVRVLSDGRKSWKYWVPAIFMIYFVFSMTQGAIRRLQMNYVIDLPDNGGKEKIWGKKYAIDAIYADAKGQPFNVFIFTPPVYTYPYDYLFLTYAKKKYGYMPGHEKKGLVYLLIEVDGTKPWSYQGWLETVIKTGRVLWTTHLPSDQLLQKRIME